MDNTPIYVIVAITDIYPPEPNGYDYFDLSDQCQSATPFGFHRTMGWFPTLAEAEAALQQNAPAFCRSFKWFLIEQTTSAFCSQVTSRTCYYWNPSTQNYVKTSEPDCLNDYPNLGLG